MASETGAAARVAGRFVLEKLLGKGASGAVYRAYDEASAATIAIKFLTLRDPAALFLFKAEFRTLANLAHPNLLQLYELLSHRDDWLLTMELVDGPDFLSYVRPKHAAETVHSLEEPTAVLSGEHTAAGFFPPDGDGGGAPPSSVSNPSCPSASSAALDAFDESRLRHAFLQLCEGLHALHRADRLHRDLKPANVLVSAADERVVICDFGLALEGTQLRVDEPTAGERPPGQSTFETRHREIAGTLPFMSPEQAQAQTMSPASDWWSVGAMLYQALTGRLPFSRTLSYYATVRAKLGARPVSPLQVAAGVPPELAQLSLALLDPNPTTRAGYAEAVAALQGDLRRIARRAQRSRAFVGRDAQLTALASAFAASQSGSATIAFVAGASGMGKSSLVQHFLARIERASNALVLRGRCYEREELPYKAIDPLMDALSSHLLNLEHDAVQELLPSSIHHLATLFPALRRVPAIAMLCEEALPAGDPRDRRRLAFRSFRELCKRLSLHRPLVLFIDDLQWGDRDSAPLFQELLLPPNAPPVLVLCAYRSEDEHRSALLPLLRETRSHDTGDLQIVDVSVGALALPEAASLARAVLDSDPRAQQAAELIAREAEGSPFFVHELSAYVTEHGIEAAGRIRLDALIEHQLDELSADGRELLSVIAVAGRPVAHATVKSAAGLGQATLKALRELEAGRLVVSSREGAREAIECHHDRIREAVYQLLSTERTRSLHRALAQAIEQETIEDCDSLLEHWRGAGDCEKALRYAERGAMKAEGALAFTRAVDLYREALSLLPEGDSRARDLRERLGHALILAGRGPEAAATFLSLIAGASASQALAYRSLATTQLLRGGKLAQGFGELARADDLFGVRFPRTELEAMAMLLTRKARIRLGERFIVLDRPSREGDLRGARLEALWEVAAAVSTADLLRGSVYGSELMLRAMAVGDPAHIAGACGLEAVAAAAANHGGRVERMIELAERASLRAGGLHLMGRVKGMQAICRQLQGRWRDSVELARASQELQRRSARLDWDYVIMIWWEMASASMAGDVRELIARVPDALRDAEQRGDVYAATSFRTHRMSWAWLSMDRPDLADHQVDIAERDWTPDGYQFQHWHMTYARSEVDLYRGTPRRSFERLMQEWQRSRLCRQVRGVRADMLFTRARLALAGARDRRDVRLARHAAKNARALIGLRMPWTVALGRLALAGAAAFDDRARASSLFGQAEAELAAADMPLHAAAAKARRGELAGDRAGRQLTQSALEAVRALGATRAEAFVQLLAPQLPR